MLLSNPLGGYSFLRGISPYSGGVVASPGFTIEHARLTRPIPWKAGFELVDAALREAVRPRSALCAMALRSPEPFSFAGFKEFNASYVAVLKSWDIFVEGINPVARTNVAPALDPPAEPSLYSFAYTMPAPDGPLAFVVAGAGELPEGSLYPDDVIRRNETSSDALAEKARFVLGLMEGRMHGLGASWDRASTTNVYTVHDVNALLPTVILPRIGSAALHGVTWHYTRPPILSIEYEMDVRGGTLEKSIPADR